MTELPRPYGERTRGVTQGGVSHAADTLFRAGERPTVEKVRAQIGGGSPNTISPMLDAWWSTVAARLDAGPAALHRLPEAVAHVAESLWLQALDDAQQRVQSELKSKSDASNAQAQHLEVRAHVLSLRESELDQRLRERERALGESQDQMMKLLRSVQRQEATIRARDTRIAALEGEVARYRSQLQAVLARAVVTHRLRSESPKKRARQKPARKARTMPKKRARMRPPTRKTRR